MADADTSVDNLERFDVFLKDYPSGQGYKGIVYYAQDSLDVGMKRFDYGPVENMEKYGQLKPPEVPLQDYNLPTALVAGTLDKLADLKDVAWLREQIKDKVVFYNEYALGHMSFALAKDMSWFTKDVVSVIEKYATNIF